MGFYDDFKQIDLTEEIEDCYVTITRKSLRFNRVTARILNYPSTIAFFFSSDSNQKKLGIAPKRDSDGPGVDFALKKGKRNPPIYVKDLHVLKKLASIVKFEKDGKEIALRVKGEYLPEDNAIVFDFNEATDSFVKPRGTHKTKVVSK